jgi:hypothetical protein
MFRLFGGLLGMLRDPALRLRPYAALLPLLLRPRYYVDLSVATVYAGDSEHERGVVVLDKLLME